MLCAISFENLDGRGGKSAFAVIFYNDFSLAGGIVNRRADIPPVTETH